MSYRLSIMLMWLIATVASAQTYTSVVARAKPQTATADELSSLIIDRGVLVWNVDDLHDLRIGDGSTIGGYRIGWESALQTNYDGHEINFGQGASIGANLSGWSVMLDRNPILSVSRQSVNAQITGTGISGTNLYFDVLFDAPASTNIVLRGSLALNTWTNVPASMVASGNVLRVSTPLTTNYLYYAIAFPGDSGAYVLLRGTLKVDAINLGGETITDWAVLGFASNLAQEVAARIAGDSALAQEIATNTVSPHDSAYTQAVALASAAYAIAQTNVPVGVVTIAQTGVVSRQMLAEQYVRDGDAVVSGFSGLDMANLSDWGEVGGAGGTIKVNDWSTDQTNVMANLNADKIDGHDATVFVFRAETAYTQALALASGAVQASDSSYTNAKAKATSAVQPTDSSYTQALALASGALQANDAAYTNAQAKALSAVQPTASAYTQALALASGAVQATNAAYIAATNRAAQAFAWGNHATSGYAYAATVSTQFIQRAEFSPSSYLTINAAQSNYLRRTVSAPTSSSDPGLPHQIAVRAINATSAWVYIYFAESNKWMRAQFNDF